MSGVLPEAPAASEALNAVDGLTVEAALAQAGDDRVLSVAIQIYGELFPGEAIDIAVIITIITTIIGFIQQCRDGQSAQMRALRRQTRRARMLTFRAVQESVPDKSRREQLRLTDALIAKGAREPELFAELQGDSVAMCPLN
jgi:hypothetical protein